MKKKKNLLFKKLAVIFAAAFLVVQLVSCGDDDPLKGGKPGGISEDPTLLTNLADANKSVSGVKFTTAQLDSVSANLSNQANNVSAYFTAGRDAAKTRLVFVITQDMFGNDLTRPVIDALKDSTFLSANDSKVNAFIFLSGLKGTLDKTKWKFQKATGDSKVQNKALTIASYNDLLTQLIDTNNAIMADTTSDSKHTLKFGSLFYGDTTKNVYNDVKANILALVKAFAGKAASYHVDSKDIAIVGLDPFMSAMAVEMLADAGLSADNNVTITNVAGLTPIISTLPAKNISLTATAIGTSGSAAVEQSKYKNYAFDGLRRSGSAAPAADSAYRNFFNSLGKMESAEHGLLRLDTITATDKTLYFATGKDAKGTAAADLTGENLILGDNVTDAEGLKTKVDPDTAIKTAEITGLTDANVIQKKAELVNASSPLKKVLKSATTE